MDRIDELRLSYDHCHKVDYGEYGFLGPKDERELLDIAEALRDALKPIVYWHEADMATSVFDRARAALAKLDPKP